MLIYKGNMKKEFTQNQSKIAVLLINFGGPDSLRAVKPFLYNLFSDPTVLNVPFINPNNINSPLRVLNAMFRIPFAWLISNMRDMTSREMYKAVGSMSPLIPITYLQAEKLQNLFKRNDLPIDVFIGFKYCKPFVEDVLDEIQTLGYKQLIILPLYPQYSYTTVGSAQMTVNKWLKSRTLAPRHLDTQIVTSWHTDEDYLESYTGLIRNALENMDLRSTEIIFSAHSIPIINVDKGDPYQEHITETASLIVQKLNWRKRWHIGYQSKLGPVKWLEPATEKVIEQIAQRSKNANILIVPISFVCEHVETIFEIGKLYKEVANKHGIKKFSRVPALNIDKYLIQAMYNQIVGCLEDNQVNIKDLFVTT